MPIPHRRGQVGTWSGIIRVHLPEEVGIGHDTAVDRYPHRVSIIHIKGFTLTVTKVSTYQPDELPTALNEFRPNPFFVSMVLERESFKSVDELRAAEFWNG